MSISFSLLEDDMVPIQMMKPIAKYPPQRPIPFMNESTECNYLVMFFIIGVILLAFVDQLK
tara:strand:+ start:829 stop:1011 length:183 start_codon:yes stop_codon:yes gene_type:complete